jgi:membrane protease subunit HflK
MSDAKDLIELILKRPGSRPNGPRGVPPGGGKPAGGFSPRLLLGGVVALLALWGLLSGIYTVQPEERAVIKRFGNVTGIADPGLHFKLPFGVDRVQIVATERVLKQEFGFRTDANRPSNDRSQFAGDYPASR